VAGLSARWGISELSEEEAEVQRVAIERSRRVVVIADGSKVGGVMPAVVGPASCVTTLVTDSSAPVGEREALREQGVEIVVVDQAAA